MERSSGIILHITSLPGAYGIGTLGENAKDFVRFLRRAGQTWWQILPLGPTGYGNSPYQSYSTFAGNPNLIDLEDLVQRGLLKERELKTLRTSDAGLRIEFETVEARREVLLRKAYNRAKWRMLGELKRFKAQEALWLKDYALFMAIKRETGGLPWQEWELPLKTRDTVALAGAEKRLKQEVGYWIFLQYLFDQQWKTLRRYANANRIKIIGDIPIYVSADSADAWSNPELFQLDEHRNPVKVSGCPPDGFSDTGQLWGNPIYRWDYHRETQYQWWIQRFKRHQELYDSVRIDHFRGFESYWEIPYGDKTAAGGNWAKGPGMELFEAVELQLGTVNFIAEDLGFLTPEVHELRDQCGYPGMRVMQFAFSTREKSLYLPYKHIPNTVVYTGTHDNNTVQGWLQEAPVSEVMHACRYLGLNRDEGLVWGFVRGAWSSVGDVAMAQMQDFLELGSEARMNMPSTMGPHNWSWRMAPGVLTEALADRIYQLTETYGRVGAPCLNEKP